MRRVIAALIVLLLLLSLLAPVAWASVGPDESQLAPNAVEVSRFVKDRFPEVPRIGGWRHDPYPDHPSGRAVDIMVPDVEVGDRVADEIESHAGELGVEYLIWRQMYRPVGGVPSRMADRGSATLNHFDHVHVTVFR